MVDWNRNNLQRRAGLSFALIGLLTVLLSVFSPVVEAVVARTLPASFAGVFDLSPAMASPPVKSSAPNDKLPVWQTRRAQACLIADRDLHHCKRGICSRQYSRRYFAPALTQPICRVNTSVLCTLPLLLTELHLLTRSSLCYHHSGRSPPLSSVC